VGPAVKRDKVPFALERRMMLGIKLEKGSRIKAPMYVEDTA